VQTSDWLPELPLAPSNVHLRFTAVEQHLLSASFDFYLRREAEQVWSYHVTLVGPAVPMEVANGTLQFDPNGRLLVVISGISLSFPHADGSWGNAIALNFGHSVWGDGGAGIDGLTSFATATSVFGGDAQLVDDSWLLWSRCSGRPTRNIGDSWVLPSTALQDPQGSPWSDTPSATTTVYDEDANAWDLGLFWHATGVNQAEYKLVASRASDRIESSVGSLLFNAKGALQHADAASAIHLPLEYGAPGPGFSLAVGQTIDQGASFSTISTSSVPSDQKVMLFPDGSPPSMPCP
jgi:hypothetical protein